MDVSAVRADPYHVAVAGEDKTVFDVCEESAVAFFVLLLYLTHHLEQGSDTGEAFFASLSSEFGVHVGPLIVLALGSVEQVGSCCRDFALVQELEPNLCMFLFISSSLLKEFSNLDKTIFLCL